MKHAADFDPTIGVRIRAPARGHQFTIVASTLGPQLRGIVMLIAQDLADLGGQLGKQRRRDLTVGDIGDGELSSQGNPEAADGHGQVQLPPVPPPVPARLAPVRLGVNRGVGHHASLPIFPVPDAAVRAYRRAGARRGLAQERSRGGCGPSFLD